MGFLQGRRILVTGMLSNRSIAYGIAKACAREGAVLAFTYQGEGVRERGPGRVRQPREGDLRGSDQDARGGGHRRLLEDPEFRREELAAAPRRERRGSRQYRRLPAFRPGERHHRRMHLRGRGLQPRDSGDGRMKPRTRPSGADPGSRVARVGSVPCASAYWVAFFSSASLRTLTPTRPRRLASVDSSSSAATASFRRAASASRCLSSTLSMSITFETRTSE